MDFDLANIVSAAAKAKSYCQQKGCEVRYIQTDTKKLCMYVRERKKKQMKIFEADLRESRSVCRGRKGVWE